LGVEVPTEITKDELIARERIAWTELETHIRHFAKVINTGGHQTLVQDARAKVETALTKYIPLQKQRITVELG
jgi:hypothetical protein